MGDEAIARPVSLPKQLAHIVGLQSRHEGTLT
jgi:hypothetical protein